MAEREIRWRNHSIDVIWREDGIVIEQRGVEIENDVQAACAVLASMTGISVAEIQQHG